MGHPLPSDVYAWGEGSDLFYVTDSSDCGRLVPSRSIRFRPVDTGFLR
jgi:hypothetical protein